MKALGNLIVGTVGTAAASIAPEKAAAIFAGVSTGVWMLTQAVIAIRNETRK